MPKDTLSGAAVTVRSWVVRKANERETNRFPSDVFNAIMGLNNRPSAAAGQPGSDTGRIMVELQGKKNPDQMEINKYLDMLRFLNESTDDYLYFWDFRGQRLYFSETAKRQFSLPWAEDGSCLVSDWLSTVHERDRAAVEAEFSRIQSGRQTIHNMEYRLLRNEQEAFWIHCRGKSQQYESGVSGFMIGTISLPISGEHTDSLTGLRNTGGFLDDLEACCRERQSGCLMVLGIDNLKNINIKYGRGFGNRVLKIVANTLEKITDLSVSNYRLDGDRFALLMPGRTETEAVSLYQSLQEILLSHCTLSAGAILYQPGLLADAGTLFQYAENALDRAKKSGKNTLVFFSSADYEKRLSLISLQEELQQSVQNGFQGFFLHFQPQIDTRTYRIFGAEALLRYTSPSRGPVSPEEFIPILEQSRLICPVGDWVLQRALEQCRIWRDSLPGFHISVNISYIQLLESDISDKVLSILQNSGVPGTSLTLELTENIQLQNFPFLNKIFYQWKKNGIQISVDDFGTGYSTLSHLKSIEIDEIKIDRCFVRGIHHSAYNYQLLRNIIDLAHSAQIRVCCEGVETEKELMILKELQPDLLQGFLFARPFPEQQFEENYISQSSPLYQARLEKEHFFCQLAPYDAHDKKEFLGQEELEAIVENMDEVIYISDIDTYELYYLNPAGRSLTGIYDYNGCKCYQILQGRSAPCEFCVNARLGNYDFHIWERFNPYLNRYFLLKDKLIPWQGKMAHMEIAIDITEKETVSQRIREKLDFEQNIVACTKMLAEESDIDQAISHVLESIGEYYNADRAYIFEPNSQGVIWRNTYEWCRPGVLSAKDDLQNVPVSLLRRWIQAFRKGKSIQITDMEEIRGVFREEWEVLSSQNIHCLISVPIFRERQLIGFIGVDNPSCHQTDDAQLHTMAFFLADRVARNDTEKRLHELLDCHYEDILQETRLGLWVIRIDEVNERYEMFADRVMRQIMGMEGTPSPEECYHHWYSRINDGYFHYVNLSVSNMIQSGQITQLEYTWNHPTQGEVLVRCLGIRVADSDGKICLEGYHRIISDMERTSFLPDPTASEMFEFNERKKSIYFHTSRASIAGSEIRQDHFPECWIEDKIVHPHFAEKFRVLFNNVQVKEELQGTELLLRTKSGAYEWFRIRTRHLGTDQQDVYTIVIILTPADQERAIELEYMRKSDFYKAILSETIAYAEVDVESNDLQTAGGLWEPYVEDCRQNGKSFTQVMENSLSRLVNQEEVEKYRYYISTEVMKEKYRQGQHTSEYCFQRYIDGVPHWVKMVIHIFQEQFSESTFALLYLRDIDVEKRRELEREHAANRDSLTNVFNRRSFEQEVCNYMEDPSADHVGTIIILDLDNFKSINDKYGHPGGDQALRHLSRTLTHTFRERDVIGRLGGDEFLVFIKDVSSREILDRRMDRLFALLQEGTEIPITCSAGIAFLKKENFSYERSLKEADIALYQSKQQGKNRYCYYGLPGK